MAGTNLFDMIVNASNGKAREQLARQTGLEEGQAESALKALLPALSAGLKANTQKPGGLDALLGALERGNHDRYLDQPEQLGQPETIEDGNAILGHLLGSKEVSREVASAASQRTGIGDDILKQALPLVASMVMGSLSKQTRDPQIQGQLAGMLGGGQPQPAPRQGGGLGALLGAVMGGGGRRQQTAHQPPAQAGMMGMLGNLLDADKDGSSVDDIFDMVMKRRT